MKMAVDVHWGLCSMAFTMEPDSTTEWIEVGALRKRAVAAEGLRRAGLPE